MSGHAFKEFKINWGMVIDLDKCTGCGACMTACQVENNIAPMVDASNKMRTLSWMLVFEMSNGKPAPDAEVAYLPRPCMQCGHPACVPVCPVVATDKNEEGGIVSQIYPRCIGCRYCMKRSAVREAVGRFRAANPRVFGSVLHVDWLCARLDAGSEPGAATRSLEQGRM